MHIITVLKFENQALILFGNGSIYRVALVWSKDDALLAIQSQQVVASESREDTIASIRSCNLPDMIAKPGVIVEGFFGGALGSLARLLYAAAGGQLAAFSLPATQSIIAQFTPPVPEHAARDENVIGLADEQGGHHLHVIFSKEQLRTILDSYPWIDDDTRRQISKNVDATDMPSETARETLHIQGKLAEFFNLAMVLDSDPTRVRAVGIYTVAADDDAIDIEDTEDSDDSDDQSKPDPTLN